jgi:O-antigen/teichoic acid export membrane protein
MPIKKIKHLKSRYAPRGSFRANVLTLMTGATIAQTIPIAISPILTRIYTPDDFGIFALYMSLTSIVSIVATGRYELAVMLPDKDEDAVNIAALSFAISFFLSFATLLVVWMFNSSITRLLGAPEISRWLYFIPLSILLTGMYNTMNYWSNRKMQYKRLAISRVTQAVATSCTNLGMGYEKLGTSGLILGGIVGQSFATGVLGWQVMKEDKDKIEMISKKEIAINAKKYDSFPKINSLHAFVDMLQSSSVVVIISVFFGSMVLGFYSMTLRVLKAPAGLIGSSMGQVFYQKASDTYNKNGDLKSVVKNTMIKLALISLPIFTLLIIFGSDLFAFVFGERWRESGVYAQILSPWIFLNFITSPISQVPLIVNKQKTAFMIGIVYSLFIFMPLLMAKSMNKGFIKGLYVLSFSASMVLIYYIFWIIKISDKKRTNCK